MSPSQQPPPPPSHSSSKPDDAADLAQVCFPLFRGPCTGPLFHFPPSLPEPRSYHLRGAAGRFVRVTLRQPTLLWLRGLLFQPAQPYSQRI